MHIKEALIKIIANRLIRRYYLRKSLYVNELKKMFEILKSAWHPLTTAPQIICSSKNALLIKHSVPWYRYWCPWFSVMQKPHGGPPNNSPDSKTLCSMFYGPFWNHYYILIHDYLLVFNRSPVKMLGSQNLGQSGLHKGPIFIGTQDHQRTKE